MSYPKQDRGREGNDPPQQSEAVVKHQPPAFADPGQFATANLREMFSDAVRAWLNRTPSPHTRKCYARDLGQFMARADIAVDRPDELRLIRPEQVSEWRDALSASGRSNATIRRKLTALRSLFSYLQVYGYTGANPAHGKFVKAPAVSRDGKTVGMSESDCRRLLDAPDANSPVGIRDRAMFGVLAYSACRVGELVRLKVGDFRTSGEHRILSIYGKGGKERVVPLHLEAVERIAAWLAVAGSGEDRSGPLFRASRSPRGRGHDGFQTRTLTTRAIEQLVDRYVRSLALDSSVTVHSFRVTALTSARERGADIIDLQDFAGHSDPRTTLSYIRSRDRLSKSPAYVLRY